MWQGSETMEQPTNNDALHERRIRVVAKGNASAMGKYISKGEGSILTDVEGNEYLDFGGGIAVMNVGHSHPKVVSAIKQQAEKLTHTCFMVSPYEPAVRLAEKLCRALPAESPKAAMFANSGAEAIENAVKIARYATGKPAIIALENAFHGRTLMGMTLTSKVIFSQEKTEIFNLLRRKK
jgi:4-aminobutyrate aminotransferase / (S)-3-amino-2-methylpropionate transaminase / 5-aminovalerate transaminase